MTIITGLCYLAVSLGLGIYLGYRRAQLEAEEQHRHSLQDLDQFKTVVSVSTTRHGTYARITTTFSPNRDRGLATGICCSKASQLKFA